MKMDNELLEKVKEIAKTANIKMHAQSLNIPVIDGFEVMKTDNVKTIFLAIDGNGFTQQMTGDGALNPGETLEDRVDFVMNDVAQFMKLNGDEEAGNRCFFVKDYDNGVFKFKLYVQDLILQGNLLRMLSAFFVEPKFNDFYQMSISVGPFPYPTTSFTVGSFNPDTEPISNLLISMMEAVLQELKYKE